MGRHRVGYCWICGTYAGDLETIGVKKVKICGDCLRILRSSKISIIKLYPENIPKNTIERYRYINQLIYQLEGEVD